MGPLAIAWRNVLRHRRRTAIALGAVGFGVVALVIAGGFIDFILTDFRETSIRSHFGHLQVTRQGYRDSGGADPYAYLLPADARFARDLAGDARIRLAAPRLYFSGLASNGDSTISFVGQGVDPAKERALSEAMQITAGAPLADDDRDGALVGEGLAANLGVAPGDTLVLLATTRSGGVNAVEVRVRGTFATVTKAFDDSAIRVPLAVAQRLLRIDGVNAWLLLLGNTGETAAVLASMRERLAGRGVEVTPWWELADFYTKTVALFSKQLGVVRFIVAVIIVLSISNTMIMAVLERTWEIGTSMALGVSRRRILVTFLLEGALLGALGGAIGLAVGAVLAVALSAIGIPMPPPPGMAHAVVAGVRLSVPVVAGAFAIAIATTVAASVYPARKAAGLSIVDALRHNR